MKSLQKILLLTTTLSQVSFLVNAICQNFGKNCPEDAPCCNNGWCSNDPKFCSTGCEPGNSFSPKSCYPQPLCINQYDDFSKPSLVPWQSFTGDPNQATWTSDFTPDYAAYTNDGQLALNMKYDGVNKNEKGNYQGFGSTVSSTRWLEYGTVTARIKTGSSTKGVVSSFIVSTLIKTKNMIGDEIDYEWVGLDPTEAQGNYYYNGTLDYTKGSHHKVGADTSAGFHTYTIEWMPEHIRWIIDGNIVRTSLKSDTWDETLQAYKFPSRLSRVQFSMWDGGMGAPGTADWAGSPTDWSDKNRAYTMYVDWVNITCYYTGNTSTTWPPEGYGPKKKSSGSPTEQGSYATLGVNVPDNFAAPGTNSSQIVPETPNYNAPTLPKLVAPIAVVCTVTIIGAVIFGVWRYRKGRKCIFELRQRKRVKNCEREIAVNFTFFTEVVIDALAALKKIDT
ncbi:hypothetical protein G9A89_010250 [Geosiphon pyriformis]|nr:hypothetical protein G9A89_010250 [Geosiphon pyriformis]